MAILGILGTLPFVCSSERVLTFKDLSKQTKTRWATHEVIGRKPVVEYIGPDADTISLTIRLDASLGMAPAAGLLLLQAMQESGNSHILIIGGEHFGRFVIESIDEDRKYHTGQGIPLVAEAKLKLKEASSGGILSLIDGITRLFSR